jgi:hypothetical protein
MANYDWLWGAIAGGLATGTIGAIGFSLDRWYFRPRAQLKEATQKRIEALKRLKYLLATSSDVFVNQNYKARSLLMLLKATHAGLETKDERGHDLGFDETFHRAFPNFTPQEIELFNLIRATTTSSLLNVNRLMAEWINTNFEFLQSEVAPFSKELQNDLADLQTHLQAWLDKYVVWIPDDPSRSLVYLADEKGHGPEFPPNVESSVDKALHALIRN